MTSISPPPAGDPASDQPSEARERLRQFFLTDETAHPGLWDKLWETGDFLPWDRGTPNPALVDILNDRTDVLGSPIKPPTTDGGSRKRRKRALVPGCGKGYDVLLLASYGYDAYGVEASAHAVKAAEKHAQEEAEKYPAQSAEVGSGSAMFLTGDFFGDEWVSEIPPEDGVGTTFDLIYDYTFLSALPPSSRPAWSLCMSRLLAPEGHLICLEFPTYKPPSTGGPPWALPPVVYEQHLSHPGEKIPYDKEGNVVVVESMPENPDTLVRIAHWMPENTHQVGKGTDWVSIWEHKKEETLV